jgi:hypothetical protein
MIRGCIGAYHQIARADDVAHSFHPLQRRED